MIKYDTKNLVPSTDPRDLDDNSLVFDSLFNSSASSVPDRLGVQRKTWHQMEVDAQALVAPNVSALAGLTGAGNKGIYFTGAGALATYDLAAFIRGFSAATNQGDARATIGAMALSDTGAFSGSAAKLTATRQIQITGDASWSVVFDGSASVTAALTLANSGVAAGTYGSVTVDAKGRATGGSVTTPKANGGTGIAGETHTALTLTNSWAVIATRRAGYRKITTDLVFLEVQISGGTATDGTAICSPLPAGYRPAAPIAIPVQSGPNTTPSTTVSSPRVVIGTDGTVVCQNCSAAPGISFTAVFSTI